MTDSTSNNIDSNIDANVEMKNEIPEEPKVPEGESISGYVNQDVSKQLMEMGYSKNVSEKALFFNQNNLENSIVWIYEHQSDVDFEEELRIVGQEDKPQLTEEEIKKKAKELQDMARKRFLQKQKEVEDEQERNRIRTSK